jgi:hypothetical protein
MTGAELSVRYVRLSGSIQNRNRTDRRIGVSGRPIPSGSDKPGKADAHPRDPGTRRVLTLDRRRS